MSGVNKAIVVGFLGRDPEMRFANGTAVASFSVATSENWKDKSGAKQERTEWHKIIVWGKLAELCVEHLKKGRQVYVEGRIQTRKYQGQAGTEKQTTEIVAREVTFLGGGSKGESSREPGSDDGDPGGEPQF